jgi:hypothetical protein
VYRKIIVGCDFKNGMVFFLGQDVLDRQAIISCIKCVGSRFHVYISFKEKPNEHIPWKDFPQEITTGELDVNSGLGHA